MKKTLSIILITFSIASANAQAYLFKTSYGNHHSSRSDRIAFGEKLPLISLDSTSVHRLDSLQKITDRNFQIAFKIFSFLFFFGTLNLFLKCFRKGKRVKEDEKLATEKKLAELKVLRNHLNPHFLFNTINSIQTFILENKHSIADSYLVKYSQLIRNILNHSQALTVLLSDELESIKLYVELEQLRISRGFDFEIKVDDKINQKEVVIPSMIIRPLIENAIWHGISKKKSKGRITLAFIAKPETIEICVSDNGVGHDDTKAMIKKSFVADRLKLLDESFSNKSSMDIQSANNVGTIVSIHFSNDLPR